MSLLGVVLVTECKVSESVQDGESFDADGEMQVLPSSAERGFGAQGLQLRCFWTYHLNKETASR